jgi:hypothetical protein
LIGFLNPKHKLNTKYEKNLAISLHHRPPRGFRVHRRARAARGCNRARHRPGAGACPGAVMVAFDAGFAAARRHGTNGTEATQPVAVMPVLQPPDGSVRQ